MARPLALILAALSMAAAVGCGSDVNKDVDREQIRSVVHQFAAADGPEACRLMSPKGLVDVYGGYKDPVRVARAECIRRSENFEGAEVEIQEIEVTDDRTVRVGAHNAAGTVTFNVRLVRLGSNWRIERVSQTRNDE